MFNIDYLYDVTKNNCMYPYLSWYYFSCIFVCINLTRLQQMQKQSTCNEEFGQHHSYQPPLLGHKQHNSVNSPTLPDHWRGGTED